MAFFVLLLIPIGILASQLEPSSKTEQFLPEDHPFQRFVTIMANEFSASNQDDAIQGYLLWGIDSQEPINREGVNMLLDTEFLGTENYVELKFDEAAQTHLDWVCNKLLREIVPNNQFMPEYDFVVADKENSQGFGKVYCFMADFQRWLAWEDEGCVDAEGGDCKQAMEFPVAAEDATKTLLEFLMSPEVQEEGEQSGWGRSLIYADTWGAHVGMDITDIDAPKLKYLAAAWDSVVPKYEQLPQVESRALYEMHEDFVAYINSDEGPSGKVESLGDAIQHLPGNPGGDKWVFMHTQTIYIRSAITGMVVGSAIAFTVLLVATRSLTMAGLATLTIVCILSTVAALMFLWGWELGTIESICLTILAGFSVDYVVHLAHAYTHSSGSTREEKVGQAFLTMGVSVFSGMFTSFLASIPLFFCSLQFFAKFGTFLCSTVVFSWIWANFFFMSLLATMGPEGGDCDKCKSRSTSPNTAPNELAT